VRNIFKDTKAIIIPQANFKVWGDIYRKLGEEYYLDVIFPSDPSITNIDDFVFANIRRCHLHTIVAKTFVMHYYKAIEWVIKHSDTENNIVINDEGICIAFV
jgi:hypothetical protein